MSNAWNYQLRIYLGAEFAELARTEPDNPAIKPITDVLGQHRATIKCQFDAFSDYVAEAEKQGVEQFPLYRWTKVTLEDPAKKAKHLKVFAVHVEGQEVYSKQTADALEADLQALVDGRVVTHLSKHDTNPANNLPIPAEHRS